MEKVMAKNMRVGLFVMAGTLFVIFAMYFIGENQSLFGSSIKISAQFYNVNGLMPGNNVRFGGINIGTVDDIAIINDSSINVIMVIKDDSKIFIKENAIASIGTDGLMGNKLVNINSVNASAPNIKDGSVLQTLKPLETDEMFRTLNRTNEDIAIIVKNLKSISTRINNPNSFWSVLSDTAIADNIKSSIANINLASRRTVTITDDIHDILRRANSKNGTLGALLNDTTLNYNLNITMQNIKNASDSFIHISNQLSIFSKRMNHRNGAISTILMDTNFAKNMNQSLENIKNGSDGFNENMEALKHNFLFRKYFRKKERLKSVSK
jgi:phospholipid/cholesterol/gamma-HCH transport system substrate-binding protein